MLLFLLAITVSYAVGGPLSLEENVKLQQDCGKISMENKHSKSIHTSSMTRHEAPFTVMLHLALEDGTPEERLAKVKDPWMSRYTKCTGTIISPRHILTAAKCIAYFGCYKASPNEPLPYFQKTDKSLKIDHFKLNYLVVSAPTNCQTDCDSEFKNLIVKPKKAFFAMDYVGCDLETETWGDLAVVELEEDIPFTSTIQPACLYSDKIEMSEEFDMYGYGMTDEMNGRTFGAMRKHSTETITNEECFNLPYWTEVNASQTLVEKVLGTDRLCATNVKPTTTIGDSGDGLIFKKDERAYVAAALIQEIFEYNNPKDSLALLIEIYPHLDWICAASGVCPGGNMTEEEKVELEKKYYTLETEDDFILEDVAQHYNRTH